MDSRATANCSGDNGYIYYVEGGWSIPYITGNYALACQVKPDTLMMNSARDYLK